MDIEELSSDLAKTVVEVHVLHKCWGEEAFGCVIETTAVLDDCSDDFRPYLSEHCLNPCVPYVKILKYEVERSSELPK